MTTEQEINVTVLPGNLEVTVGGRYMLVTDTRGGAFGWKIALSHAKAVDVEYTANGSAPGLSLDGNFVIKDATLGPAGSTGGQWLVALDRDEDITVSLVSDDIKETTWDVGAEAVTRTFGTGKNETS